MYFILCVWGTPGVLTRKATPTFLFLKPPMGQSGLMRPRRTSRSCLVGGDLAKPIPGPSLAWEFSLGVSQPVAGDKSMSSAPRSASRPAALGAGADLPLCSQSQATSGQA